MTNRPTIAFVHGAFADSSGWSATISALDAARLPVIAIPNQLRGLTADADYVRSVLATIEGPVVLVGHSYGGAVIGEAARDVENVAALVFVAAYVLDEGESISTGNMILVISSGVKGESHGNRSKRSVRVFFSVMIC